MSQTDTNARVESATDTVRTIAGQGREYVSKAAPYLRYGAESGTVMAILGGIGVLDGLRTFLSSERDRGLTGFVLGAAFLAAAVVQRRSRGRASGVEATDVVDTGTDLDAIADEVGGVGGVEHATGEAAAEVADTSPNIEDVGEGLDTESDVESAPVDQRDVVDTGVDTEDFVEATEQEAAPEPEEVDRLGQAAIDRETREVPAPQRAFNQGFLAHSTEVHWGIRTGDDAVLVSQDFDAVQGLDGVRYVASSEIESDVRELPVPNTVLEHWDDVFGGGTAVAGGDDVLFVTTEGLAGDNLLWVLPAEWADDVLGD